MKIKKINKLKQKIKMNKIIVKMYVIFINIRAV